MKTVGELLRQARIKRKQTLRDIAEETKIRLEYLQAIEANQFNLLPAAAFVKGFIQTFARSVGIEPERAIAVFRRDFDQNQQGKIVPRGMSRPLVSPARIWNPRTTTVVLGILVSILVGIYGFFQLRSLHAAPPLDVSEPKDGESVGSIVEVKGVTSTDSTIQVNNQPVSLDMNGNFTTSFNLSPGEHTIVVQAESRDGKTSTVSRTIKVVNH